MPAPHWLRTQLSGPSGWLARPMAHLLNRFNGADYRAALAALDAQQGEVVLEIGFGGGVGVETLLQQGVHVVASEPSVSMRARAHRRWAWPLAEGQLEIDAHKAETRVSRSVDRALSMNTVYFWDDIELGFANLRRDVKKRVVLGISSPTHLKKAGFDLQGFRVEPMSWYQSKLEAAGFQCSVVSAPNKDRCDLLLGV